jgi:hypothetical protein
MGQCLCQSLSNSLKENTENNTNQLASEEKWLLWWKIQCSETHIIEPKLDYVWLWQMPKEQFKGGKS